MNSSDPVSNEPTPEAVATAPPPLPETPPPLPPVATEKAVAQAVPVVPPSPQTQELSRIAQDLQTRRDVLATKLDLLHHRQDRLTTATDYCRSKGAAI